jgi:hypothetical protein
MKAILIDSENQEVKEVEYSGDYNQIYEYTKCQMFTVVRIDEKNDIFVDDEGLLNGTVFGFEYDGYPLMGNGLVLAHDNDGESVGTTLTVEEVREKVAFTAQTQGLQILFV